MRFVDVASIAGVKVTYPPELERTNRILLAPDTNDVVKDVLVGHCTFASHSRADLHVHSGIELIYVLAGHGLCHIDGEALELVPDRLVTVPAGVVHDFANSGEDELKLMFILTPAETAADIYQRAVQAAKKYHER